jgi:short-subunit dehydrogenase
MTNVSRAKVVITGASTGIGYALAKFYLQRGAMVALIARRGHLLRELAQTYRDQASVYDLDVRDAPALQAAARDFSSRVGAADLVIANAGVSAGTLTEQADDNAVFEEILAINVRGMMQTFQAFLPPMRKGAGGTLVGIASVAGFRGLPGAGAYSASKAAAISYLESLRVELSGSGIAVVTLCPGYIVTPMTEHNPYRMPFILSADDAARRMARVIDRRRRIAVVPWQMAIIACILRWLPRWLYDMLLHRAPHHRSGKSSSFSRLRSATTGSVTLIVVMPISCAGFRLMPRSSR